MLSLDEEAIASANRSDEARADVHATGFWSRRQGAFFEIRAFHPNAPSCLRTQPASLFRKHEMEKKREYRDRVEHGSFTALVFSTFSGLDREATVLYSRLADLPSKKHSTGPFTPRHFEWCFLLATSLSHPGH